MLELLFATVTRSFTVPADLSKGAHLYGSCQAAVTLSDDTNSARAKAELVISTYCFGCVGGYIDGLNVLTEEVCIRGARLETIARVYVIYIKKSKADGRGSGARLCSPEGQLRLFKAASREGWDASR